MHSRNPVTPGRGLPPVDLVRGVTEVTRTVFTIVLGRPFVGLLRWPVAVNTIAFTTLVAGFWFGLMPAFEGATPDDRTAALWGYASWILLAPPLLAGVAGPFQRPLRAVTEGIMLGPENPTGEPETAPTGTGQLRDRFIALVLAAILLLFCLAIVQIPWAGVPLVFAIGAALQALVWFNAPLCQRGYDRRDRAIVLWLNRWRALGVGVGLQIATAVPFVNLLLLPSLAAVATTSAFVRFEKLGADDTKDESVGP